MIGLLLLLGLGASFVLFDLFDTSDVEQEVDEIDPNEAQALLDENAVEQLRLDLLSDDNLTALDENLEVETEPDLTLSYEEIEGTSGDDLIQTQPETVVTFGGGGDDTILGSDSTYENVFGDEGDDVIFGVGGEDLLLGGDGDDLISGGDGDDELVGEDGTDTIFGGAGDDLIYDGFGNGETLAGLEGLSGGTGNDQIWVTDGLNIVSLGEGSDGLAVVGENSEFENNPIAVVTDFDPEEDALVLSVNVSDDDLITENSQMLSYSLQEIVTNLGPATVVIPAVNDESLASDLESASIGVAVLQGVTIAELEDANIAVLLTDGDHNSNDEGSVRDILNSATA